MQSDDRAIEFLAELTELELRVARRADELARAGLAPTKLRLGCWIQAEQEILDPAWQGRVTVDARRRRTEQVRSDSVPPSPASHE